MINNINNRITELIDKECNGNKRAFSKRVGVAPSVIENIVGSRGTKPSFDVLEKVLNAFAYISADWLITGKGQLNLKENAHPNSTENLHIQKIDLHTQNAHPISKNETLIVPIPSKAFDKRLERQDVPLYDFDAVAGLTPVFNGQSTPVDYISIPNMPKVDGAVPICGDSMYPLLKSGDIVMYKIVSDLTNIIWGEMYLISMYYGEDDYISVKYIKRVDDDPSKVLLVSYNTHHSPKEVPIESIRALGLIKATVRFNTMG